MLRIRQIAPTSLVVLGQAPQAQVQPIKFAPGVVLPKRSWFEQNRMLVIGSLVGLTGLAAFVAVRVKKAKDRSPGRRPVVDADTTPEPKSVKAPPKKKAA